MRAGAAAAGDPLAELIDHAGPASLCSHLPSGFSAVPAGNATSSTHCWPPQSNPSSSSLQPTRVPSLQVGEARMRAPARLSASGQPGR